MRWTDAALAARIAGLEEKLRVYGSISPTAADLLRALLDLQDMRAELRAEHGHLCQCAMCAQ